MKKFVLFAAAGLLTTATIVYASVAGPKKQVMVNSETKKEVKKSKCSGSYKKSMCTGSYTRTT